MNCMKTRHPDAPDARGQIHLLITRGIAEQFLGAVDQVAGAEPEEANGERRGTETEAR